jgi:hypothetical protein
MAKTKTNSLAENVNINTTRQTLINVIHDQFARLDSGEVRALLETQYGTQVWNNEELLQDFEISHFDPPYVHVIRKTDAVKGTVAFNDEPRFYFSFQPLKG